MNIKLHVLLSLCLINGFAFCADGTDDEFPSPLVLQVERRQTKDGSTWEFKQTIDPTKKGLAIFLSLTNDERTKILHQLQTSKNDSQTRFLHLFKNIQIELWKLRQAKKQPQANIALIKQKKEDIIREFTNKVGISIPASDLEPMVQHAGTNLPSFAK